MKNKLPIPLLILLLLSACSTATTGTPVADASQPASPSQETFIASPATVTATATSTTTLTSTPVPPPPLWYWAYDVDSSSIVTVNLEGETHSLGELDLESAKNYIGTRLDDTHFLLLVALDTGIQVYLLNSDAMQKINLPAGYPYDPGTSPTSMAVVGIHNRNVMFTFATRQSMGGHSGNDMPSTGPAFFVDTASLTARVIDTHVAYDSWTDTRTWFHPSNDGRLFSYLNGDPTDMKVRQVDLLTGETRTLASTTKSPFSIFGSPSGDLWYLPNSNIIVDNEGNQVVFNEAGLRFRPLEGGKGIIMPVECTAPCSLQVKSLDGSEPLLSYSLPWSITGGVYYPLLSQVLPDQSLLFAGYPDVRLENPFDIMEKYPGLLETDVPFFRLLPDGEATLVGISPTNEFAYSGRKPISQDGRYILLKAQDKSGYFLYDTRTDQALFTMPIEPGLDYFYGTLQFFEPGILLHLTASTADNQYRDFYSLFLMGDSQTLAWEDPAGEILGCPDLHADGTLTCWLYREAGASLVIYNPVSQAQTPLLDGAWILDYLP